MQAYLLTGTTCEVARYYGTLTEAHAEAKDCARARPHDKPEIRIELIEVSTDKAAILRMLNDQGQWQDGGPRRTWALGDRGGLREVNNGE